MTCVDTRDRGSGQRVFQTQGSGRAPGGRACCGRALMGEEEFGEVYLCEDQGG